MCVCVCVYIHIYIHMYAHYLGILSWWWDDQGLQGLEGFCSHTSAGPGAASQTSLCHWDLVKELDVYFHMGLSINRGTQKWLVFVRDNPNLKWMITGGSPISGNLHVFHTFDSYAIPSGN